LAKFTEVLRSRNFFFLWLSQIISQFGDRLNQMALIALVYQRAPGSTWELAKLFTFVILPVFLIGPVAGAYVDRWNRKKVMVICDLLRGVLVFLIPVFLIYLKPIFPIYIIVFAVFSITRFFLPAKMAIIPDLVSQDKLLLANSLATTTGMIAAILSFGLGGLLVAAVGARSGFYIDAASYFVSGAMVTFISLPADYKIKKPKFSIIKRELREAIKRSIPSDIKDGLRYLINKKEIRSIVAMLFILWSAIGAIYVIVIVFIQQNLGSVTKDLGLLAMFLGVGLFLGSLVYGRLGAGFSRLKTISFCLVVSGLTLTGFTLGLKQFPSFFLASMLAILLGLGVSPIIISSNTLIHEVIRKEMRGRIFSSLEMVVHLAFLIFMFASSFLAEYIDKIWILISTAAVFIICGLLGLKRFN
jgi:MFS family permease